MQKFPILPYIARKFEIYLWLYNALERTKPMISTTENTALFTATVTRMIQAHIVRRTQHGAWEHLVMRRSATEQMFPNMWQVVTGSMEEGEAPLQTAFREITEETGISVDELWLLPHVGIFYDALHNAMNLVPCFAAILYDVHSFTQASSTQGISEQVTVRLSEEHSEYEWCDCVSARQRLVIPSHQYGIETLENHILPLLARGEMPVFARFSREIST
jgi:dihydroneopterin triphosphate diphosphatase